MGGQIFVGIRRSDDARHYMYCWTNPLPWKLLTPSFWDEGAGLEDFLGWPDRVEPDSTTKRLKRPRLTSQYGVVYIDFKSKFVYSNNGYFTPGTAYVVDLEDEERENLLAMYDRGWLDVETTNRERVLYNQPLFTDADLAQWRNWCEDERYLGRGLVVFRPEGWTIVHVTHSSDARTTRAQTKAVLAAYGWI